MNTSSHAANRIHELFLNPNAGVVGLVDQLLEFGRDQTIQLRWEAQHVHATVWNGDEIDETEIPIPKSMLRAVLARLATLCNENNPGSVSPYGGDAEIITRGAALVRYRLRFSNTPDNQALELAPVTAHQSA